MDEQIVFIMIDIIMKNGKRVTGYFDHTRFIDLEKMVSVYRLKNHEIDSIRFAFVGEEMDVEKVVFDGENMPKFFTTYDYISNRFIDSMN